VQVCAPALPCPLPARDPLKSLAEIATRDPRKGLSLPEQHVWKLLILTKAFTTIAPSHAFLIEHREVTNCSSSPPSAESRDYRERWISPHLPKRTALRSETKVLSVCLRTSVSSMFMWMHFLQLFAWKIFLLLRKRQTWSTTRSLGTVLYLEAELGFFISLADWG